MCTLVLSCEDETEMIQFACFLVFFISSFFHFCLKLLCTFSVTMPMDCQNSMFACYLQSYFCRRALCVTNYICLVRYEVELCVREVIEVRVMLPEDLDCIKNNNPPRTQTVSKQQPQNQNECAREYAQNWAMESTFEFC